MTYILEGIGETEKEKILQHASKDERKLCMLKARGGFFNNEPNLTYAVNKEKEYYLVLAPRANYTTLAREYYFRFDGCLYRLSRERRSSNKIILWETPKDASKLDLLKKEVGEAFLVYGFLGSGIKNEDILDFDYVIGGEK